MTSVGCFLPEVDTRSSAASAEGGLDSSELVSRELTQNPEPSSWVDLSVHVFFILSITSCYFYLY